MGKIFSYLYNNKRNVIKYILIILFALLILHTFNQMALKKAREENVNNISSSKTTTDNLKYTVINNKEIEEENIDEIQKVMNEFISYCNNKEIDKAYEYITDDCKNAMYTTKEMFESNYIKLNFLTYKEASLQAWSEDSNKIIYIVRLSEDMLSSGKVGNVIEEYYTFIKQEDGTYKININNYIYGEDSEKEFSSNGITIKKLHKDVYRDYVKYEFELVNNTSNNIYIEDYIENLYLKDNKSIKYSIIDEKAIEKDVLLGPNGIRRFSLKFNKRYTTYNLIRYITLKNIIMDYPNKNEKIKIDIEI